MLANAKYKFSFTDKVGKGNRITLKFRELLMNDTNYQFKKLTIKQMSAFQCVISSQGQQLNRSFEAKLLANDEFYV